MFRYKSAKHKSNYVRVTIPFNVDGLFQTEYTLVLPLFGKQHEISAQLDTNSNFSGEIVLNYAYDNGVVKVCGYNWEDKGYYTPPPHYTRPFFNLYKHNESNTANSSEKELALKVSSDNTTEMFCSVNDGEMQNFAEPIKANLQTVYDYIRNALSKAGVSLQTHVDDIVDYDNEGNIVGGRYVEFTTRNKGVYFYNVDGSTGDPVPEGGSWIDYYNNKLEEVVKSPLHPKPHPQSTCTAEPNPGYRYCSSENVGGTCTDLNSNSKGEARTKNFYDIYLGGHILLNVGTFDPSKATGFLRITNDINKKEHQIKKEDKKPGNNYYMLPICKFHNNGWNKVMQITNSSGEDVLTLNYFEPGK